MKHRIRPPMPWRFARIGSGLIIGVCLSLLAPFMASADWDYKVVADYQSSKMGKSHYRTSSGILYARNQIKLGSASSLLLNAQFKRQDDFETRDHLYAGQFDADYRGRALDLFLRHRPSQRRGINHPADWRHKETAFGGALRLNHLPLLQYHLSEKDRMQGSAASQGGDTRDERFSASGNMLGLHYDYAHRHTTNTSPADTLQGTTPSTQRTATDNSGGVAASRSLFGKLVIGASYRASASRWERTERPTRRTRFQRSESHLSYRPWRSLQLGSTTAWRKTRTRTEGESARTERHLDLSFNGTLHPAPFLTTTLVHSYRERRRETGNTKVDYTRANLHAEGAILPDLRCSGGLARSWIHSQESSSAPSNQLNLSLTGALRPGAELALSVIGQALEGVPRSLRYQITQTAELRLRPRRGANILISTQAYRLGERVTLRHADRIHYRAEGVFVTRGGGSVSLNWRSQTLRTGTLGSKYSLGTTVTLPWRSADFSWNATVTRASDRDASIGRSWGFVSACSVRTRIRRQVDLTVTQSRTLPAVGSGSSIWQASLTQRFG